MGLSGVITIILFGSLWGLLEATIGGALHLARTPYTGTIMSSIGFALLYAALRAGTRPSQLFAVSLVAASFKFLDPILFGIPFLDRIVINPAMAIAMQGLAFSAVFRKSALEAKPPALAMRFMLVTVLSMAAFNAISLGILGWPTNHTEHIANALLIQMPATALASTAFCMLVDPLSKIRFLPRWQAVGAISFALLAVVARIALH